MNSEDVQVAGIAVGGGGVWLPLNIDTKHDTLATLPQRVGVYLIRAAEPICRAQGKSDIAYIGKGVKGFGIYGRFEQHIKEASTTLTSGRVRQWIEWRNDLSVGYILTRNGDEAGDLEIELLEEYDADHMELPPINRKMG